MALCCICLLKKMLVNDNYVCLVSEMTLNTRSLSISDAFLCFSSDGKKKLTET